MRKDPKKESLRWLTQAERELKDAKSVMELGSYYLTLFLCQQSAEKAIELAKSAIELKDRRTIIRRIPRAIHVL